MGGEMNDGSQIGVLIERMNNYLDSQKRIEGQLDMLVKLQLAQESMRAEIKGIADNQVRLFKKSDTVETEIDVLRREDIAPLKEDSAAAKKAWRIIAGLSVGVPSIIAFLGWQYHPWEEYTNKVLAIAKDNRDIDEARYRADIGNELHKDDGRLTVLEFRLNDYDHKSSGGK